MLVVTLTIFLSIIIGLTLKINKIAILMFTIGLAILIFTMTLIIITFIISGDPTYILMYNINFWLPILILGFLFLIIGIIIQFKIKSCRAG